MSQQSQKSGHIQWRWLILALILCGGIWPLLRSVVSVHDEPYAIYLGVYRTGPQPSESAPVLVDVQTGENSLIRFTVTDEHPASNSTLVIGTNHLGDGDEPCYARYKTGDVDELKNQPISIRPMKHAHVGGPFKEVVMPMKRSAQVPPVYIDCFFDLTPGEASFSRRHILFQHLRHWGEEDPQSIAAAIVLRFPDQSSMQGTQISGGAPNALGTQLLGDVNVTWTDDASSQLRDFALVAIGAILGVAGSCFVEAFRRVVDRE